MNVLTEPTPPVAHGEALPEFIHLDHHDPDVAHHFANYEQQREVFTLGMWAFLAQEIMFFGGLFVTYGVFRYVYPDAFHAGSSGLSVMWGGINTTVLLLSSFSMAMGVYYAQVGKTKHLVGALITTLLLGFMFLGIKWVFEWTPKFEYGVLPGDGIFMPDPHHYHHMAEYVAAAPENLGKLELFYFLYFVMTGMHALHMIIGAAILIVIIGMAIAGQFGPRRYATIENFGLYWHFVDIVWVFLFPLFYLIH